MKDEEKTKEQLISELAEMRQRVDALETPETERNPPKEGKGVADELLNLLWESERARDGIVYSQIAITG